MVLSHCYFSNKDSIIIILATKIPAMHRGTEKTPREGWVVVGGKGTAPVLSASRPSSCRQIT